MTKITVYRPDVDDTAPDTDLGLAPRRPVGDGAVVTIIENGKPNARILLQHVAAAVQRRLPVATVEVFSKPSAAKPIEADEARVMAARAHLVITGVGD
jgi:hypothetical protein